MNAPILHPLAVTTLAIDDIVASPTNPRKTIPDDYLDELAASIAAHGVIQPITVRPNPQRDNPSARPFEIVVGECRWRAAPRAGLAEIPALCRDLDDRQVVEIQVIENLQRRDLHPMEEAEGYARLIERAGYTAEEIAEKIGKSRSYVYGRLKLTALHAVARDLFTAGHMGADTALLVARIPSASLQAKAARAITQAGRAGAEPWTFRAARDYLRNNFTVSLAQATFPLHDAMLVPAAGACIGCPHCSGYDPELQAALGGADICTDTQCFDDKQQARRDQLLALAQERQIPVLEGDAARKVGGGGYPGLINRDQYVPLDAHVDNDSERPTYRELLGAAAPVSALVEVGLGANKHLAQVADPTALAAALERAGINITPEPAADDDPDAELSAYIEQRRAGRAKRDAVSAAITAERQARTALLERTTAMLAGSHIDISLLADLLPILAAGVLRQHVMWGFDLSDDAAWLARWGIELPEEFDDTQELPRIVAILREWAPGRILAFLLDDVVRSCEIDTSVYQQGTETLAPATTLGELSALLGVADAVPGTPESADDTPAPETPEQALRPDAAWPFPVGRATPPQAAPEQDWPQPNEHGVYDDAKATAYHWRNGKASVTLRVLQIGPAMWISSVATETKGGGSTEPLTMQYQFIWPSHADALEAAADRALDMMLGAENKDLTSPQKKSLRAWLTDLANVRAEGAA